MPSTADREAASSATDAPTRRTALSLCGERGVAGLPRHGRDNAAEARSGRSLRAAPSDPGGELVQVVDVAELLQYRQALIGLHRVAADQPALRASTAQRWQ